MLREAELGVVYACAHWLVKGIERDEDGGKGKTKWKGVREFVSH